MGISKRQISTVTGLQTRGKDRGGPRDSTRFRRGLGYSTPLSLATRQNRQNGQMQVRVPAESVGDVNRARHKLPGIIKARHIFEPSGLAAIQRRHTLQERKGLMVSFQCERPTLKVTAPFFQSVDDSQQFLFASRIASFRSGKFALVNATGRPSCSSTAPEPNSDASEITSTRNGLE